MDNNLKEALLKQYNLEQTRKQYQPPTFSSGKPIAPEDKILSFLVYDSPLTEGLGFSAVIHLHIDEIEHYTQEYKFIREGINGTIYAYKI